MRYESSRVGSIRVEYTTYYPGKAAACRDGRAGGVEVQRSEAGGGLGMREQGRIKSEQLDGGQPR